MSVYSGSCCAQIKMINDALERQANSLFSGSGLTLMQASVLVELDAAEGNVRSLKWLERKFGVSQPTMHGIVSRLSQKGLVTTYPNPEDAREKFVQATGEGIVKGRQGLSYMDTAEEKLLETLEPEERGELARLLGKVREHLH